MNKDDDGKELLVLNDGVVHRKAADGDVSVVRFQSYAFDLSAFSKATDSIKMYPKDRKISYLLDPDPNDEEFQENPRSFEVELHRRFSEWMYSIVFAVIALAVAGDARSHREGRINPLITVVAICLFVRWLGFFVTNQAQSAVWLTPFIYLVPLGAMAVSSWFIINNRTMELPVAWSDRTMEMIGGANQRMSALWARI